FTRRFDENWPLESVERVKGELKYGFDARSRPAVARAVLSSLSTILHRRRFVSRHGAHAMFQGAMNVLLLDVATSVALHNDNQIRQIRKRSAELADAVGNFGKIVHDLREMQKADVSALGGTAAALRQLAVRAEADAKTAAGRAADTLM